VATKVTMPFGKYAGQLLTDLPDQYVAWLLTPPMELREPLRQYVLDEASRRDRVREAQRAAALVTKEVIEAADEIIRAGVRALMRTRHPDAGGSVEAMTAVNSAADLLRALVNDLAARYQ
jgi:Putative quorum-sensing-regulated virulence factor